MWLRFIRFFCQIFKPFFVEMKHFLSIFCFWWKAINPSVELVPIMTVFSAPSSLLSAFPPFISLIYFLLCACLFFFFSSSSHCPLPHLFFPPFSASLFSPAKKINCPAVFRACWAITTRWKSRSVTFQSSAENPLTARLPLRRNRAHLCLAGTSAASVAAARAVSGLLSAPRQVDLHPSPRNVQDLAARGATAAVAAAAAVAKDTEGRCGKRSQVNTVEGQIIQSHTHRVRPRAPWVPPAATATCGAPCLRSSITARSATAPSPHETERPTGTRPHGFTPPSPVDSTRVRPFHHLSCPNPAPCSRSPQRMCGLWTARKRQNPRAHKQKATADSHTAAPWERWSPTARPHFPNSRSPHSP